MWSKSVEIGIDASRTTIVHRTGTEGYSWRLINELLKLSRSHRYVLYFREPPAAEVFPYRPQVRHRVMPFPRLWTHLRLSWEMARCPPDLLFVPAHVLPLVRPRRTVVTLHDVGYLYYPRAYRASERWYLHLSTLWSARVATRVIAISEATKQDLVARYGVPPHRIAVVPLAADKAFRPIAVPALLKATKNRYGIEGDYLLYVGTLQPRKNLEGLLEAYAALKAEQREVPKLVMAGKVGWAAEKLRQRALALGLGQEAIFAGYVLEEDLPTLMSGTTALVLPSFYEGFGLPALEAMACGTPVIASKAGALPEVVADAGLLFDPHNTGALCQALATMLADPSLRQELGQRGLERAKAFSWQRTAQATMSILEEAAF